MDIVIIGTGNIAHLLAKCFSGAAHRIVQWVGRNEAMLQSLAAQYNTAYTTDMQQVHHHADLYIMAVSDDAIAGLAKQFPVQNALLVHTAGSIDHDILLGATERVGTFYPLQSVRKENNTIPPLTILVDAANDNDATLLYQLGVSIHAETAIVSYQDRLHYHLCAVMVSNFTNYLYTLSESYLEAHQLSFKMLLPLIHEVTNRLEYSNPYDVQTGPAVRNDVQTIEKHLALLSDFPQIKEVYALMTKLIRQTYEADRFRNFE